MQGSRRMNCNMKNENSERKFKASFLKISSRAVTCERSMCVRMAIGVRREFCPPIQLSDADLTTSPDDHHFHRYPHSLLSMLLFLGHLQSYPSPECIRFTERCQVSHISVIPYGSKFLNSDFVGYSPLLDCTSVVDGIERLIIHRLMWKCFYMLRYRQSLKRIIEGSR